MASKLVGQAFQPDAARTRQAGKPDLHDAIAALVDDATVSGLTDAHGRQILAALDSLKAFDPACGSGAYLLGLLHELVALCRLLMSEKLVKDRRSLCDLKLRIISNNLYGVDIDPFAANIAMLRLWLSLEVEADEPLPLPNLDFKIETGDSLLGPDPGAVQGTLQDHRARLKAGEALMFKESTSPRTAPCATSIART